MKKLILSLFAIGLASIQLQAQTIWSYDFGTGSSASYTTNNSISTTFAPLAPANGGGISMVRRSNNAGGSINLINTAGDVELSIVGPSGNSANKFAIYDYDPAKVATIKFRMRFSAGTFGSWSFVMGNGANFPTGSVYTTLQTFTDLEFDMSGSTVTTQNRAGTTLTTVPSAVFTKDVNYEFEMYFNNSTTNTGYTRNGAQTVAPNTYDLWIDGILVGDNLAKGGIANDSDIDSFMFYGVNGTGTAGTPGTLFLDNIVYANYTAPTTLPVSLTSFTGKATGQAIDLNWATASEKNSSHFDIMRSSDNKAFTKIGFVNAAGSSDADKSYTYKDVQPLPGNNYYQLNKVDLDGSAQLSEVITVKSNATASNFKIAANKANNMVDLTIYAATSGNGSFVIYDLSGKKLISETLKLDKGYNNFVLPVQNTAPGLHIATLVTGKETITNKFIQ